jgi:hypothetical protein
VALRSRGKRQKWEMLPCRKVALTSAPYGECLDNGKRVEDPKEAAVIQLIMEWWRAGLSHCAIARRAEKWSQPTVGFIIKRQKGKA